MLASIKPLRGQRCDRHTLPGKIVASDEPSATQGYAPQAGARIVRIELDATTAQELGDLRLGTPALAEIATAPVEFSTDSTTLEWPATSAEILSTSDA